MCFFEFCLDVFSSSIRADVMFPLFYFIFSIPLLINYFIIVVCRLQQREAQMLKRLGPGDTKRLAVCCLFVCVCLFVLYFNICISPANTFCFYLPLTDNLLHRFVFGCVVFFFCPN